MPIAMSKLNVSTGLVLVKVYQLQAAITSIKDDAIRVQVGILRLDFRSVFPNKKPPKRKHAHRTTNAVSHPRWSGLASCITVMANRSRGHLADVLLQSD